MSRKKKLAELPEIKACMHCGKTNIEDVYCNGLLVHTSHFFFANGKAVCSNCMKKYHGLRPF